MESEMKKLPFHMDVSCVVFWIVHLEQYNAINISILLCW